MSQRPPSRKRAGKTSYLIVAHGSREASANREFIRLVGAYNRRHPSWTIAYAFLDVVGPSIPEALENLSKRTNKVLVLPFFLFNARHVKRDIPRILRTFQSGNPRVQLKLTRPLGLGPRILDLLDAQMGPKEGRSRRGTPQGRKRDKTSRNQGKIRSRPMPGRAMD